MTSSDSQDDLVRWLTRPGRWQPSISPRTLPAWPRLLSSCYSSRPVEPPETLPDFYFSPHFGMAELTAANAREPGCPRSAWTGHHSLV